MDNKAKEANRPLDREELTLEQEAKVVGGINLNTANFNTANINLPGINMPGINMAGINLPR